MVFWLFTYNTDSCENTLSVRKFFFIGFSATICLSVFSQMEGKMVHHLAIDRPSHKFVSFLKKYYGLKNAIPQVGQTKTSQMWYANITGEI